MDTTDKVDAILRARGVTQTRAVPPKLALPILEESSLEEDESLQSLWNSLLANAMDPKFNGELRYGFVDIIKNITGIEAVILNRFYGVLRRQGKHTDLTRITEYTLKKEQIMQIVDVNEPTYQVGIHNLMRMQCVAPAVLKSKGIGLGSEPFTIYKGTEVVVLTPLGIKFVEACMS